MEPLLAEGWEPIRDCIERERRVLLATDFDGTLAPIVPEPDLAAMSKANRSSLQSLSESDRFSVAIVTGRRMEEIRQLVRLDGVYYAANYGMEIDGPHSFRYREPKGNEARSAVASLVPELDAALMDIRGVVVENKTLSITVHYRHVGSEHLTALRSCVHEVTRNAVSSGLIEVREGQRRAIEVLPVDGTHKGDAVALIMDHLSGVNAPPPWPIYMGDDLMDEDGFRVANERGGVSVAVNPAADGETHAQYYARSPAEVSTFLERVAQMASAQS